MNNTAAESLNYQTIEVKPLLGALGAEISGVDISKTLSAQCIAEIRRAWLDYHVVVFRDQSISPPQQKEFAQYFGELDTYPFVKPLAGHPEVIPIIKEANNKVNFGGGWHTDTSYQETPPMATILYAIDVPDVGGDTLFANMVLAYQKLSPGMRRIVDGLYGIFSSEKVHGSEGIYKNADHAMEKQQNPEWLEIKVTHPIARTHPETGQKNLYVSLPHMLKLKDMRKDDSELLMKYLGDFIVKPEFTTRVHWRKGTLVMWDNRCVQHYALNDYAGKRREMHRVTLKGDKPF